MHCTWNHRFCFAASLWGLVLVAGCNRPPGHVSDAAVTPDAAPDAEVVVVPPLRTLQQRGLFGQTPVENRFFDPSFSLIDGISWNPFLPMSWDLCTVTRLHQRTPTGQPALRLEPPEGRSSGSVVGMAKGAPGPMEVSVWIGRPVGAEVNEYVVSFYGLFLGDGSAVDLQRDENVAPVELDGVTWVHLRAHVLDGPASWAYLSLTSQSAEPLYITAPVLMRVAAQTRRLTAPAPAPLRPLLPRERAAWQDWQRRLKDRFGGVDRSPRL